MSLADSTRAPSIAQGRHAETEVTVASGAEWLVRSLEAEGVDTIFGYPGGAIMPVYDALPGSSLRHILTRHEQGAALAADGYARVTGRPGVCLATSGPGATNLLTGIANAFLDSVPLVAITGQVASAMMGTDAFQEVDIFGMTLPVVKHSYIVRRAEEIPNTVREAFQIASSGRPGPVLIDLPKDVAKERVALPPPGSLGRHPARALDAISLAQAAAMLASARRPVLYVGGGVGLAGATQALRGFAERHQIPAVATLKGLGALPTDHPLFLGMLGMHGHQAANLAVQGCDLLVVLGARFDDRATGELATFAPGARVLHMDVDPAEISKLRRADLSLCGDLRGALANLDVGVRGHWQPWLNECLGMRQRYAMRYDAPGEAIYAPAMLKALSEQAGDDLILTCDVGQHQMWVAQHCRVHRPEAHLTSGGLGTMGYGVPAGIGACLADPTATVVTVTGDGSIMMNIQELATLKRYNIPLKILLLDNAALGMVRQWQELFFDGNYSEVDLSDNPDFAELARAFGLQAFTVERRDQVAAAIDRLLTTEGPVLAHVKIDPRANVWPLVPPGKSNADMLQGDHHASPDSH
jgi:acetolactate synthase-1/2/3 large subunit